MSVTKDYQSLVFRPETGRIMIMNHAGEVSSEAKDGVELRFNQQRPFDTKFPSIDSSVVIQRLPVSAVLPDWKINGMVTGKPEEFRVALGFTSKETSPLVPTVAIWASVKSKKMTNYELILGGPDLNVFFPMSKFLGLDGKSQGSMDTIISLTQPTASLRFIKRNSVTEWNLIQEV